MTYDEVIDALYSFADEKIKEIQERRGPEGVTLGVKVESLKTIQKKIKRDYGLSKKLFDSGITDAQYLAGLIADPEKMTAADLDLWAKTALTPMISEYTVAWVCSESPAFDIAYEWIESSEEKIASSGWGAIASYVALVPNEELDYELLKKLVQRVEKEIPDERNRVKYVMNSFLIAVGSYVPDLTEFVVKVAEKIGKVKIDHGKTACKTPYAPEHIQKALARGTGQRKRKSAIC